MEELAHWQNWLGYFVLGNVQYHLHFLPTLFFIFLFFPVMRLGTRYPILGLTVFPTLAVMHYVQGYFWQLDIDPLLREFMLRAVKVMGYVGYGFAAFAMFGIWKDGLPRGESKLIRRGALFFAATAYMATIPFYGAALLSGSWGARDSWSFFGHFLMPLFMFALFMGGQYESWSPRWSKFAKYTFGIYLVHPMVIDVFDVLMASSGFALEPWQLVIVRYLVVLPASALAAIGLSRLTATAWTIGLGPAPWEWGRKSTALVEG
jgi:surface polysaccharide O-acyltransferase-like enzyme